MFGFQCWFINEKIVSVVFVYITIRNEKLKCKKWKLAFRNEPFYPNIQRFKQLFFFEGEEINKGNIQKYSIYVDLT